MPTDQLMPTRAELAAQMHAALEALLNVVERWDEAQLSGPTDHAGWTVRDHLINIAVWAEGLAALLRREDRWAAMGVTMSGPDHDALDVERLNLEIAAQPRSLSGVEALAWVQAAHNRVAAALQALDEAELSLPYGRFLVPFDTHVGNPIWSYIAENTFEHYAEHLPWLTAIVEQQSGTS